MNNKQTFIKEIFKNVDGETIREVLKNKTTGEILAIRDLNFDQVAGHIRHAIANESANQGINVIFNEANDALARESTNEALARIYEGTSGWKTPPEVMPSSPSSSTISDFSNDAPTIPVGNSRVPLSSNNISNLSPEIAAKTGNTVPNLGASTSNIGPSVASDASTIAPNMPKDSFTNKDFKTWMDLSGTQQNYDTAFGAQGLFAREAQFKYEYKYNIGNIDISTESVVITVGCVTLIVVLALALYFYSRNNSNDNTVVINGPVHVNPATDVNDLHSNIRTDMLNDQIVEAMNQNLESVIRTLYIGTFSNILVICLCAYLGVNHIRNHFSLSFNGTNLSLFKHFVIKLNPFKLLKRYATRLRPIRSGPFKILDPAVVLTRIVSLIQSITELLLKLIYVLSQVVMLMWELVILLLLFSLLYCVFLYFPMAIN